MLAHKSVLLNEVIDILAPKDNEKYIDATFGFGGYSRRILEESDCKVLAFDRDSYVSKFVDNFKKEFGDRFEFINDSFSNILQYLNGKKLDALILDLGVSSMQIDDAVRGFSFQKDAALDMRMNQKQKLSAFEVVNEMEESALADIIYQYGDERKSRQIAKAIVNKRQKDTIKTTSELARIIKNVIGNRGFSKIDSSTKTFQAIRIYVNDEVYELKKILADSKEILASGGKLIVVSFHSVEDKIVKNFLRKESGYFDKSKSRYENNFPRENKEYAFFPPKAKAIKPKEMELKENIRSRSARLRFAIKT